MAKQRVYYLVSNNGDGSASVHLFKDKTKAEGLCSYSHDGFDETYNLNEDGPKSFEVDGEILGLSFHDND